MAHMRSLLHLLTASLLLPALGCSLPIPLPGDDDDGAAVEKPRKRKPKPKKPAPTGEWQKYSTTLEFKDLKSRSLTPQVSVRLSTKDPGSLQIMAMNMPGAKIEMGDQTLKVPSTGIKDLQIDFRDRLSLVALEEIKKGSPKVEFDLKLKVELAGYKPMEATVPPIYVSSVGSWFASVANGALLFPGEVAPTEKAKPHVALLVHGKMLRGVVGIGGTLRDIDWVAVATRREAGSKKCSGYDVGALTLNLFDSDVAIYERRTGVKVDSKSFRATGTCPRTAYVGKDRTTSSSASSTKIKQWVTYKLTGRGGAPRRRSRRRNSGFGRMLR